MPNPNMLDIVKMNCADHEVGLIEESIKVHPELSRGAARTIKGRYYKTLIRTALGRTTGSFRNANEGSTAIKGVYENRLIETFIMEPRFEADKAVADSYDEGPEAYIAIENSGILEGEMRGLCSQLYYGNSGTNLNNAKGFPGLINFVDASMVIDAAGTTANTGSSAWAVLWGPKALQWVWGNNKQAFNFSPVRIESLIDPSDNATPPTKKLDGYVQTMQAYPGIQVGSINVIARIKNITADSGKGLTDILLSKLVALFPTGIQPSEIYVTRRSIQQLQASRTATSPTGQQAPFPKSVVGLDQSEIPLVVTDSITNTEAIA